MINSNFHTHSLYSDGKSEMHEYCEKAMELGFHSIGFSDHAPVLFDNSYSIPIEKLDAYFKNIEALKKEYLNRLKIFTSLEADYIPGKTYDFNYFRARASIDYMIGSIHLVYNRRKDKMWFIDGGDQQVWDQGLKEIFDGDIKQGVMAFFEQSMEMVDSQKPEVIGHLDKIKMHNQERLFSTNDKWYRDLIDAYLTMIKKQDAIIEINTRGLYKGRCKELFPSIDIALKAQGMGIPLLLSSDAHLPGELNGAYEEVIKTLQTQGINELLEYSEHGWQTIQLSS